MVSVVLGSCSFTRRFRIVPYAATLLHICTLHVDFLNPFIYGEWWSLSPRTEFASISHPPLGSQALHLMHQRKPAEGPIENYSTNVHSPTTRGSVHPAHQPREDFKSCTRPVNTNRRPVRLFQNGSLRKDDRRGEGG